MAMKPFEVVYEANSVRVDSQGYLPVPISRIVQGIELGSALRLYDDEMTFQGNDGLVFVRNLDADLPKKRGLKDYNLDLSRLNMDTKVVVSAEGLSKQGYTTELESWEQTGTNKTRYLGKATLSLTTIEEMQAEAISRGHSRADAFAMSLNHYATQASADLLRQRAPHPWMSQAGNISHMASVGTGIVTSSQVSNSVEALDNLFGGMLVAGSVATVVAGLAHLAFEKYNLYPQITDRKRVDNILWNLAHVPLVVSAERLTGDRP